MWWFWVITAGIFFVIEIMTVGFLVFWLGLAALLAACTSFFTSNLLIQTVVFVISSTLFIIFTRPIVNKFLKLDKNTSTPTNIYSIIGKEGIVIENIDTLEFTGKVKVAGQYWTAISDTNIEKDTHIKVLEVQGVKLKVEPIYETSKIN